MDPNAVSPTSEFRREALLEQLDREQASIVRRLAEIQEFRELIHDEGEHVAERIVRLARGY